MKTYSNPRRHAVIENWPSGGKRVTATFAIERHPKHGERAVRTTTGASKKLTYAKQMRIVDGDDGRTYIASRSPGLIDIWGGNLQGEEYVTPEGNEARYAELMSLFDDAAILD